MSLTSAPNLINQSKLVGTNSIYFRKQKIKSVPSNYVVSQNQRTRKVLVHSGKSQYPFSVYFEQHHTPTSKHTFTTCFVYFHNGSLITCNMAQRRIRVKKRVCAIHRILALDGSAFFKWNLWYVRCYCIGCDSDKIQFKRLLGIVSKRTRPNIQHLMKSQPISPYRLIM